MTVVVPVLLYSLTYRSKRLTYALIVHHFSEFNS
jgi:hypothetical protein